MLVFQRTIKWFFIICIISLITLLLLQSNKPLPIKTPYLYINQAIDTSTSRIIRTSDGGKTKDIVYEGKNIQNFAINGELIMVAEGLKSQKSALKIFNIKDKKIQDIDFKDKHVDKILSFQDKFLMLFEDASQGYRNYRGQIGIYNPITKIFDNPNPQFYATDVSQLYINPSGNLAVFTGFNSYKFLMDLNNYNNITRLEEYNYTSGFMDESSLISANYNKIEVKTTDVVTGKSEFRTLPKPQFQEIIGIKDEVYYTERVENIEYNKYVLYKLNRNLIVDSGTSYENLLSDKDHNYIAMSTYTDLEQKDRTDVKKQQAIEPTIQIIDTKKDLIINTNIQGKQYTWGN
jgi:hypothetical protein